MADDQTFSGGIDVGDAILRVTADLGGLEESFTKVEQTATQASQRTVDKIQSLYKQLSISGTESLRQMAESAQQAFEKLSASGVASLSDLVQAEARVIETQNALKKSLGEVISPEVSQRLADLKQRYSDITSGIGEVGAAAARAVQQQADYTDQLAQLYSLLGVRSTASLFEMADHAQQAFEVIKTSGAATLSDLLQAEIRVIEAQNNLTKSWGDVVPPEALARLDQLKQRYADITSGIGETAAAIQRAQKTAEDAAQAQNAAAEKTAKELTAQTQAQADEQKRIIKEATDAEQKMYGDLGIAGSRNLKEIADNAQAAFTRLQQTGTASIGDLVEAEARLIETQITLNKNMGNAVPAELSQRLTNLKQRYSDITSGIGEVAAANKRATDQLVSDADRAIAKTLEEIKAEKELYATASKAAEKAAGGKDEGLNDVMGNLFGGVSGLASGYLEYQMLQDVQNALTNAGKAALDFEGSFSELMSIMDTKTPGGRAEIQALKEGLQSLPPELGNITELTRAAYDAISSGIAPVDALTAITQAATFARASLSDIPSSVRVLTAVLNAYGISANNADQVTSALNETVNKGVIRGQELAQSLGQVIPIAAGFKIGLTDVLGALAGLTLGGLDAAESVTSLKQIIVSIQDPSKEAQKAFKDIGLDYRQLQQAMTADGGLPKVLQTITKAVGDNTDAATQLFGNVRALNGEMSLAGPNAAKYKDALDSIKQAYESGTSAADAMRVIVDGQKGSYETFGNYLQNSFIKIWDSLTPITNAIGGGFAALVKDTGLLQLTFGTLGAGVLTLGYVFNGVKFIIDDIKTAFNGLVYGILLGASAIPLLGDKLNVAGGALQKYGEAFHNAAAKTQDDVNRFAQMNQAFDKTIRSFTAAPTQINPVSTAIDINRQQWQRWTEQQALSANAALEAQKVRPKTKAQLEEEAKAAAKAEKALEEYAKAHNIPLSEELSKAVRQARSFYDMTVATHAPLVEQNAALINYTQALVKFKSTMDDVRTVGQIFFDIGKGKSGPLALIADPKNVEQLSKLKVELGDAEQSFEQLLDAEQRLGIIGSATLANNAQNAEISLGIIRAAYQRHQASLHDVIQAEAQVEDANRALAASFGIDVRSALERTQQAEQTLGIVGTAALKQHAVETSIAFDQIKAANDKGVASMRELQRAELAALEADAEYKREMGVAIPASEVARIRQLTGALGDLERQQRRNAQVDTEWYQFWHGKAPSIGRTMSDIAEVGKQSFVQLEQGFGQAIEAFESGQESLGSAIKDAVAKQLEAMSAQDAILALEMLARAAVAAATGDFYAAGQYATAAAIYGTVAVAAGGTAMAMGGGNSGQQGSASGSTSGGGTSISGGNTAAVNPTQATNVQRFGGGALVSKPTLAIIGDKKGSTTQGAREGILPLDDPQAMQTMGAAIADAMTASGNTTGGDVHIHIAGLLSTDSLDKTIDNINDRVGSGKRLHATSAGRVIKKGG